MHVRLRRSAHCQTTAIYKYLSQLSGTDLLHSLNKFVLIENPSWIFRTIRALHNHERITRRHKGRAGHENASGAGGTKVTYQLFPVLCILYGTGGVNQVITRACLSQRGNETDVRIEFAA